MAGQVPAPIGLFNVNNVRVLSQDHFLSPLASLFIIPPGNDVAQLAVRAIVAKSLAQARRTSLRLLSDDVDFEVNSMSEMFAEVIPGGTPTFAVMPALFREHVLFHISAALDLAGNYAQAMGPGGVAGPLAAHATAVHAQSLMAITMPPAAACPTTLISVVEVMLTVLTHDQIFQNRLLASVNCSYIAAGITLAKRGHITRDYLRKRLPGLRSEFQAETLELSTGVIGELWARHFSKVDHNSAVIFLDSFSTLTKPENVILGDWVINDLHLYQD